MRALLLIAALAGCHPQTTRDPRLDARIAALEARIAEQDKQLASLRSDDSSHVELAALAAQVQQLADKLAAMPPPRPKRKTPDPSLVYAVPVGTSATEGPATAKVTMVMAFDFACPYCRKAWDTVGALEKHYGADLRVVFKHYVVHAKAQYPAQAACAANRQGKFRALADLIWTKAFDAKKLDDDVIDRLAKQAKLDMKRYRTDLESCAAEVQDDENLMRKLAASATPTFFINGRFVEGAKDQEVFETLIDAEKARAEAAIAAGTPPDKVYETEVLAKGLSEVTGP